ncbi:MAG: MBOAT family protein [Oscillospiraceae bacterium]|nr:MBOAT family protein [Oscillospiraceae bacterium]
MVFASLIFVFLFFISNIITQAVVTDMRKKNIVMLSFSLVFYAWAGIRFVPLLLGMTFICWISALLIDRYWEDLRAKKLILVVCIVLVLLILGIFKYTGFFLKNVQLLFGFPKVIPTIVLPIGISFYTFQLLSYVIDVYRGDAEVQRKYWLLLLYASLFHQCIAGPIVRYRDVYQDILHRRVKRTELSRGITRFAIGLAKKAVLANGCAAVVNAVFGIKEDAELTAAIVRGTPVTGMWLVVLAYTLQIYLDFSAYSDMAIGMGLMCGFHYKENFDHPYVADSVTDFWRRWHISLSTFFRDYVYIPLGGNRCSRRRHILNLFIVWFLTGMWHGASWNYILWGLYYFVFLVIEKYLVDTGRIAKPLRHLLTLLIVYFGWAIFKFEDGAMLGAAFKGMFGLNGNAFAALSSRLVFRNNVFFLIFCALASLPLGVGLGNMLKRLSQQSTAWLRVYGVLDAAFPVLLVLLSMMALAGKQYNPFIYFQF